MLVNSIRVFLHPRYASCSHFTRCVWKVSAGGRFQNVVCSKEVMVWTLMSDMLIGCRGSCVVSVGGGDLVVMGGSSYGDGGRCLAIVQVFDGKTIYYYSNCNNLCLYLQYQVPWQLSKP